MGIENLVLNGVTTDITGNLNATVYGQEGSEVTIEETINLGTVTAGYIENNGSISSSLYAVCTARLEAEFTQYSYTGSYTDGNNVPIYCQMAEYTADNAFIKKTILQKSDGAREVCTISDTCKYVVFNLGRNSSTSVQFNISTDMQYFSVKGTKTEIIYEVVGLVDRVDELEEDVSDIKEQLQQGSFGITHAVPPSVGVLNCIKRARQFTDIKWTPAADIPRPSILSNDKASGSHEIFEDVFLAGVEYTGIPYSETNATTSRYGYSNMMVGLGGCGLDTFVSSVENEGTVVEEESSYSPSGNGSGCYFGTICSGLVSYAYGFSSLVRVNSLPSVSGMASLGALSSINPKNIKLGDMLYIYNASSSHVALITDLIYADNGDVLYIEVSEATKGGVGNWTKAVEGNGGGQTGGISRRRGFDIATFYDFWEGYTLYRYGNIDSVTYQSSPYVNVGNELDMLTYRDMPCIPYMGNGFKYKVGYIYNSDVICNCEGYTHLKVFKDGSAWNANGTTDLYTVSSGKVTVNFSQAGEYKAYLCKVSGNSVTYHTIPCYWTVVS